jgi:hypothetical protein
MARYHVQLTSATALAANTGFGWLMASANNGYKLRRVTIGTTAGTSAPTSQQLIVGINRVTTAGTTPTAGMTPAKLDPNSAAAGAVWNSAYATPPTLSTNDDFQFSFNSQSGVDLPWDYMEEFVCSLGTANGLCFINRTNALPTGMAYLIAVEWEE